MANLQKLRSSALMIRLIKDIQDVPPLLKKCVDELQKEVYEIKELQIELQNETFMKELADDGKFCGE